MVSRFALVFACALFAFAPYAARAADDASNGSQSAYAKFVSGAQVQSGLFGVIRKNGKVYIEIAPSQLGQDFVQTAELANGLGGYGLWPGGIGSAARIIRFTHSDDSIVVTWPNTFFVAPGNEPAQRAIQRTFADSPIAVAPVVATDPATGHLVFDASFLLGDVYDLATQLKGVTGEDHPDQAYRLDPTKTIFGPAKAFPLNIVVDADQTWRSGNPQVVDNVPDPRSLLIRVAYNIAQPPNDPDYMPRLADDRLGYFDSPHLDFSQDTSYSRILHYVIRWNLQPSDPSKAVSPAKHPIVYYLSNEIPVRYRATIRTAILRWNAAFERAGISDAVKVLDQPADANWDPDDIRYNTVLWLTESNSGGFAAASPVFDPRTGQAFRANIVIDADFLNFLYTAGTYIADPDSKAARLPFPASERELAQGLSQEAGFGLAALDFEGRPLAGAALERYVDDALTWTIMHESGHALGLQHNFIGTQAYSVKQMQSRSFTRANGLSASVMDYVGVNVWPKGQSQGAYWQTMLGPYDYRVIHWGYAHIPGARTPQDERPTLDRWASGWADPRNRFASDEDVSWFDAHAVDPRVVQWDLTDDPLTWGAGRVELADRIMHAVDSRWPLAGHSYDQEVYAFLVAFNQRVRGAVIAEHFIGGEYLSRSHAGELGASPPLVQVPRSLERRAFQQLDRYVFSDGAWNFSPATLNRLVYSEWEPFVGATWAYTPQPRHDLPVAEFAQGFADNELAIMFQPLMLERLDDLGLKAKPGTTMSLTDLFDWTQDSVYGDLRNARLSSIGEVHRGIQQSYARLLVRLWLSPQPGTPYDAQSLARAKLVALRHDVGVALSRPVPDQLTRAHLESLQEVASRALDARQVVPVREPQ